MIKAWEKRVNMSAGMTNGIIPRLSFEGSPADSVRTYISRGGLTSGRAGYELARQTLYLMAIDNVTAPEYLTKTLLTFANDDDKVHRPPLSDELTDMCEVHLATEQAPYAGGLIHIQPRGQETAMLLNQIIDHGTQQVLPDNFPSRIGDIA